MKPDPKLDMAWKDFINDQNDFREKIQNLSSLPASIASYFVLAKSIPVMFAIAGALVLKVLIDGVIDADKKFGNYGNK